MYIKRFIETLVKFTSHVRFSLSPLYLSPFTFPAFVNETEINYNGIAPL
jgi:hypothetical protein